MEGQLFKIREKMERKSDSESKLFREDGNIFFMQMRIYDAILAYNKSLIFAESKLNLALAYGNRSAAYFEAKLYAECIKSIKLAREHDYPAEKKVRLTLREQKCLKLLEEEQDPAEDLWSYLKLSYPANNNLPFMIEDLEMRTTKKYGRGVYAKRDLKPGDIICIEETKVQMVDYDGFFKCCNNCSKTSMMNFIPCLKTASFMFCSTDCRDEFYKYADLSTESFYKDAFLLKKIEAAFGDLQSVKNYLAPKPTTTIFDFDLSDEKDPNYMLNIYKCYLAASTFPIIFDGKAEYHFASETRKLMDIVAQKMICNPARPNHIKHENQIFIEKLATNINDKNLRFPPDKLMFSTFGALLNHSCLANVEYFCIENTAVFYVQQPIKANEQLFTSYVGDCYKYETRVEILSKFAVPCNCVACVRKISFLQEYEVESYEEVEKLLREGDLKNEVCCVQGSMLRIKELFETLSKCTAPKGFERVMCIMTIHTIYRILADRLMFPA